jgi:hypothetical protein
MQVVLMLKAPVCAVEHHPDLMTIIPARGDEYRGWSPSQSTKTMEHSFSSMTSDHNGTTNTVARRKSWRATLGSYRPMGCRIYLRIFSQVFDNLALGSSQYPR